VLTNTQTTDLATSPQGVHHTLYWDTFNSGVFGQSDNVVVRIIAYPDLRPRRNGVAGPYQRASAAATTFPFRVRGTQAQVLLANARPVPEFVPKHTLYLPIVRQRHNQGGPISPGSLAGALVYRLEAGQSRGALPLGNAGQPFRTDHHGFLPGRGEIKQGDILIALLPVIVKRALHPLLHQCNTDPQGIDRVIRGYARRPALGRIARPPVAAAQPERLPRVGCSRRRAVSRTTRPRFSPRLGLPLRLE
jgi:hypothetical protein